VVHKEGYSRQRTRSNNEERKMKTLAGWIAGIVLVGGLGAYGYTNHQQVSGQYAYDLALAQVKREFLTQTSGVHQLDADTYRKEIGPHLSAYFRDVRKLSKKYPQFFDVQRERAVGERKRAAKKISAANKKQRDERIDLTLALYNNMMQGQFRPVHTQSDKNFRFDLHDISKERVGSQDMIRFSFVHWGPFDYAQRPNSGSVTYQDLVVDIKLIQDKGKPAKMAQMATDGPPTLQVSAEKWVKEFPPGAEIGYYEFPLFPAEAETASFTFNYGIRTIGGSENFVSIAFKDMEVVESWKMGEGETWKDHERFASDKELQAAGVSPTQ
jgi:hypothetical protein